jgi:hypothetical protein
LEHIRPVDKEMASDVGMILPLLVLALGKVNERTKVIVSFE